MSEITELLAAARTGEPPAVGRLYELLYPELSRLARARLRRSDQRLALDTVALVNETYLRMLKLAQLQLQDRSHFMAYCARVMRTVLVDLARELGSERRGQGAACVTLDTALGEQLPSGNAEVQAVHDALLALEQVDERLARVVEMRYFVGLENAEIADALGVGLRTVERDWEKARAYLHLALRQA